MKSNKGITLVALVITIIVLLILAGVSIAALGGQNGILTNASRARQEDAIGSQRDTVAMAINEATNAYYSVTYAGSAETGYNFTTAAGSGSKVVGGKQYDTAVNFIKDATYTANQDAETKSGAARVEVGLNGIATGNTGKKVVRIETTDDDPIYIEAVLNSDGSLGTWTSSAELPEANKGPNT